MKIEHLTLGGSAVIRDTADILPSTKKYFSPVGWEWRSQVLNLPGLPFAIKISAADEGVIFDIQKNGKPVITNICGFDGDLNTLKYVKRVADVMKVFKVIEPVTPNWLYSIIINPLLLKPANVITAGEVELYIFERLYDAWKVKNSR